MLWFFPSVLAIYFFQGFLFDSYKAFFLFLYSALNDHFFYFVFCILGYLVFFGLPHIYASREKFGNMLAFFFGFFSVAAFQTFFADFGSFDLYSLFILPLTRCFSIVLVVFLLDRLFDSFGRDRIIYGALIFAVILLCGLVTFFFMVNFALLAILLAAGLLAGSIAAFLILPSIL
jgi:hypothetical protein